MSGIFGIVDCSGRTIENHRLEAMSGALEHRGPDGAGVWRGESSALGHRLLSTTPESVQQDQPFHDEESGLAITFDGRLDSRYEMIHRIGREQFRGDVISDCLIVLYAYRTWREECVRYLLGDFAFAIWDSRNRELFCARDHLGVKPFTYSHVGDTFLFCSEPWVIAQHSGFDFTINEGRIADSLTPHLEGFDKTSTFYQGIYRLPPGHSLTFKNGKLKVLRYWIPEPVPMDEQRSDDEYREELTDILSQAVEARCTGVDNPAILLSGGIDSASVMVFAKKYCVDVPGSTLHTYSGVSDDIADCKESRLISLLAGDDGLQAHRYTPADITGLGEQLFELVSKIHEPFDIIMILAFLLYSQAAKHGNKVVMDGVDGDMALSLSYGYPSQLITNGYLREAVREALLQNRDFFEGYFSNWKVPLRLLATFGAPQFAKDLRARLRLPKNAEQVMKDSPISAEFAQKTMLRERLIEFDKEHRRKNDLFPQEVYINQVLHPFITVGLERYDRVASLCSVEPRHPLLDKRIIDFYTRLPWNQFVRNGWSKFLFRKVAEPFLPSEVCWRTGKEHVGWSFTQALLRSEKKNIQKVRENSLESLTGYLKQEYLSIYDKPCCNSEKNSLNPYAIGLSIWLHSQNI